MKTCEKCVKHVFTFSLQKNDYTNIDVLVRLQEF